MRPISPDDAAHARLAASRAAIARSLAPDAGESPLALLAPTVRQHPWALVGGAALAGALLVAIRPWRWLPGAPVLFTVASQLAWRAYTARRASARRSAPVEPRPPAPL